MHLSSRLHAEDDRPWVKICGLRDAGLIDVAIARGADEIGLVHFAPSPRHLEISMIAALIAHIDGRAGAAVVAVDPNDEAIDALAAAGPSALQLHGSETPERAYEVRKRSGISVMKAISVGPDGPVEDVSRYGGCADRLLLDAKAPKGSALPGGNGIAFDWSILPPVQSFADVPFMLSGGLHAGNVANAIRTVRPFGVDVSSGVESAPGIKSADLINRFFDAFDAATLI